MIGQHLNGYEIHQEAGRGDAATVYVARQHPVERYVAVKVFDHLTSESVDRLRQLFDKLEALDHPNILPVYDRGETPDNREYWVMRYMPAGSLKAKLRDRRLTPDEIERVLAQIVDALDYAQQHDLVHGDLKPANILFDHAGHVFVADFGLAAVVGSLTSDYEPPELRRALYPDARSDVYGLGAILYELWTGRPPYDVRARTTPPLKPSSINPKVPAAIDQVVMTALAAQPDQRYPAPRELLDAYRQARAATPEISAAAPPRINVRGIVIGIIGLLIVSGAIALFASQSPAAAPSPTDTPAPTSTFAPTALPAIQLTPMDTPTPPAAPVPSSTSLPAPTRTATATPTATSTLRPTAITTRLIPTATPTIAIAPLTLLIPRKDEPATLSLSFGTRILPADRGVIGILSMSIPPIEPYVIDRGLAQVGSGEQAPRVSITIDCHPVIDPIITRQIIVTLTDERGSVLLSQTFDYTKRWCQ
jgi:serine/threonine-protein kinase